MARAAVVGRRELLESGHPRPALGEGGGGRRAHPAEADHDHPLHRRHSRRPAAGAIPGAKSSVHARFCLWKSGIWKNATMPRAKGRTTTRAEPAPTVESVTERLAARLGRPAVSARRHLRRLGHQLLAVLQRRRGRRAVPVRRRRRRRAREVAHRADRGRRPLLARLPARRPARASATATGCTARGTRPTGCGATRPSCCSTPTPRRSTARSTGTRPASPTTSTTPTSRTPPTARRTCRAASSATRSSTGATTARPSTAMHETIIYEAHVKGLTHAPPRRARGAARHVRGARPPGGRRPPRAPRRHRDRADAGAPVRPRPPPRRARPAQLLGLQLDRLPRPAQRLRQLAGAQSAARRARCRSSRRWSRRCTRPASR